MFPRGHETKWHLAEQHAFRMQIALSEDEAEAHMGNGLTSCISRKLLLHIRELRDYFVVFDQI